VLYGYGGFNVPLLPAWSSAAAAWVEAGGVWCVANLRGGSEYGEAGKIYYNFPFSFLFYCLRTGLLHGEFKLCI
jgi:hypothetical protein